MTTEEKIIFFYDVLEVTSPAFVATKERPITDIVLNYLNESQLQMFNGRYLTGDFLTNVETVKRLKHELGNLLEYSSESSPSESSRYSKGYEINEDWTSTALFVEGVINVNRDTVLSGTGEIVELVPILDININKYLTNYTNVPIILQPVVFMDKSQNKLCIIVDKYTTINNVTFTTLKKPDALYYSTSIGSELDERFHEELVRNAVTLFLNDKIKLAPKESKDERPANAS